MTRGGFGVLLVCLLSSVAELGHAGTAGASTSVARMRLDDYRTYLQSNPPLDRLFCHREWCAFLVTPTELRGLEASGTPFSLEPSPRATVQGHSVATGGPNGRFHDYEETRSLLLELESRYPELASVASAGRSVEGRELLVLKISDNVLLDEDEPNVFVVGCHHAREWISVEVPLGFAEYLLEGYATDPEVARAVRGAQIYVLPLANPDGLEFSIDRYRWWRKNRQYNGDLSWGVDLNRNYGHMWGVDDEGSSPHPDSAVYRGPYAFSEPETSAIRDLMLAHPPAAALTYHSYGQLILYPWGYTREAPADQAEMDAIAREMSRRVFAVNGRLYEYGGGPDALYSTNGDFDDWVYATFGAPSFTVELPAPDYLTGGFFVPESEIDLSVAENVPAILYLVNYYAGE